MPPTSWSTHTVSVYTFGVLPTIIELANNPGLKHLSRKEEERIWIRVSQRNSRLGCTMRVQFDLTIADPATCGAVSRGP